MCLSIIFFCVSSVHVAILRDLVEPSCCRTLINETVPVSLWDSNMELINKTLRLAIQKVFVQLLTTACEGT
jgi:hypothetical protein